MFSLTSQIKRAADSISLNISEGSLGNSNAEYKRFLTMSSRSCGEVVTCLYHARMREYINEDEIKSHYDAAEILFKMINKLKSTLK
jgi:four helix bundle protein